MKRWIGGYLAVGLLVVVGVWLPSSAGTMAQNAPGGVQATEVADLQTRVAALETTRAQASAIADLQTRVAALETAATVSGASPAAETVLFEANAQTGFDQWTDGYFGGFTNQFTVQGGMLVAAAGGYTVLYAPYLTTSPDYILEAEIQILPPAPATPGVFPVVTIAGLAARFKQVSFGTTTGYFVTTEGTTASIGVDKAYNTLVSTSDLPGAGLPDPREGWHLYRFEVRGDHLRFLIDGVLVAEATDARYSGIGADGRVGLVASLGPLEVRSFRVLAWE